MTANKADLEPLDPRTATELFLDHKSTNCAESTVRNHRYRLKSFLEFCEEQSIDNLNHLSGRNIHQYRMWRNETGDINELTLRMHMSGLRVFLKWAATMEAVPEDLYSKVMVPRVDRSEHQRDEMLDSETAAEILEYLSTYEYASVEHTLLAILWETGIRLGAVHSIDLQDVDTEEEYLRLVHRPNSGTTLKNGEGGERLIAITAQLAKLLEDYIENIRPNVTDEFGRTPLISTAEGRQCRTTIRRTIYRITAPCYRDEHCPDCERGTERKCPSAVCPHAIRRGSITHYLKKDVPEKVISDRMNVSPDVLDAHYDNRTESVKMEQRREYLDEV